MQKPSTTMIPAGSSKAAKAANIVENAAINKMMSEEKCKKYFQIRCIDG